MPFAIPDLDDRNFDDLFRELVARVPVHTPEWTNLTENDPGVTLLELFAFLADNLSYRSNRIPEATRQTFLTLLGRGLQPATPATGSVAFSIDGRSAVVEAGTVVRSGRVEFRTRRTLNVLPVEAHVFWKRPRLDLDATTLEHLRRLHEPFLGETGTAQLAFYDTVLVEPPSTGVALPVIDLTDAQLGPIDHAVWVALATTATAVRAAGNDPAAAVASLRPLIAGHTLTLGVVPAATSNGRDLAARRVEPDQTVGGLVVEAAGPGAAPTYQRLDVTHADDVLDRPGVLDVALPALDRLVGPWDTDPSTEGTGDRPPVLEDRTLAARVVTWLRLRPRTAGTAASGAGGAALSWVGTNIARVVQAVEVVDEPLGTGTGAPDQQMRVAHPPVLLDDADAAPTVEVQDEVGIWHAWQRTTSLPSVGPDEQVWAVDPESGVVRFGSGLHGMRPPAGVGVRISYRYGGGPQGVVPIGAISKADGLAADITVANPLPTAGGAAAETVADAERSIPAWLRHRDRAVTASDFRDIALHTPGVDLARVDVLPLFDPRPTSPIADLTDAAGAVTVLVVPWAEAVANTPPATTDPYVLDAVCRWLDPRRLITTQVHVRGPRWVPLVVAVGLEPMPGEVREAVEQRVRAAIQDTLSALSGGLGSPPPDGQDGISVEAGGLSPVGWPLGMNVRADDLAAATTRVNGVRSVTGVRIAVTRDGATTNDVADVSISGLELPFATVFASVGPPDDPTALLGSSNDAPTIVPVPTIPKVC